MVDINKLQKVQDIINTLEGKPINISATNCIIKNGDIIWDYQDEETRNKLNLKEMDSKELQELKEELEEYL